MEWQKEPWALLSLKEQAKWISPDPPTYQREKGGIWTLAKEQLLIDSVLRRIDIPKIYLRRVSSNPLKYEVVDGQQRINALLRFLRNEFRLVDDAPDLPLHGQNYVIAGKTYSASDGLDEIVRTQRIFTYNLDVVIITVATEDEVADLFYRLNNGVPLSAAEVRNCMCGKVTPFVRGLAEHPFFNKCRFSRKRRGYDQMAAQMLCLEINGGSQDISDKFLTPMYHKYETGIPNKVVAALQANLGLLDLMFPGGSKLPLSSLNRNL
jgi:hypothetical protein